MESLELHPVENTDDTVGRSFTLQTPEVTQPLDGRLDVGKTAQGDGQHRLEASFTGHADRAHEERSPDFDVLRAQVVDDISAEGVVESAVHKLFTRGPRGAA
jgi:hypothetical protein